MLASRLLTRRPGAAALVVRAAAAARGYATVPGTSAPLIDVSPVLEPDHPRRGAAVREIGDALRAEGYFYAQGVTQMPASYIAEIYRYAAKCHALPLPVKRAFSQRDGHGAYAGPDVGQPELAYEPGTVSTVHAWDYSRTRFTLASGERDANRYPEADVLSPPYAEVLGELYERQNALGRGLMGAFAETLGLPAATFAEMFAGDDGEGDFGTIRLLHYPRPGAGRFDAEANLGISPHTDFEAFTLMHQDAPGLQFIPASGEGADAGGWVDAPVTVRPAEFVVIVGDVLERFTNGLLRATPHRVVLTPHARNSIIRFNAVAAETLVTPLPAFITPERPAAYTPVRMRTHMETTMRNLEAGVGAWDAEMQRSRTATYRYAEP